MSICQLGEYFHKIIIRIFIALFEDKRSLFAESLSGRFLRIADKQIKHECTVHGRARDVFPELEHVYVTNSQTRSTPLFS